jgi:hypothetical protein
VCTCKVLCPCWIGEDPDGKTCEASLAYRLDKGEIDGVDVSGLTVAGSTHIPGNVFDGNWRLSLFVSEEATDEQMEVLRAAFTGQRGGPLADLAQLHGEVVEFDRARITFDVREGKGRYTVGDVVDAEIEPYRGATGELKTLNESVFSTIPGSPAYVAKAPRFRMKNPKLGQDIDLSGHNAIQGSFAFEA